MENESKEITTAQTAPAGEQLAENSRKEPKRVDSGARKKSKKSKKGKRVLTALLIIAALVLAAAIFFPVMQISSSSMAPALNNGDIVVLMESGEYEQGQIICFTKNGKTLVKRVIGTPGDTVDIDEQGNVYVNGALLDEPYVQEKALGDCDISFPYTVPDGAYFVLADNRAEGVDSRSSLVESVNAEKITGRVLFRLWPFGSPSVE